MDVKFKNELPPKVRDLVNQIEGYCGLELSIRYDASLKADGPKIFARPNGEAVRVEKVGVAHTIIKFNADALAEIGIAHCEEPLAASIIAHELLHLKHILVDQVITRMQYLPGFGLDDSNGGFYKVLDYIEHRRR
jgi:hypothetical protein